MSGSAKLSTGVVIGFVAATSLLFAACGNDNKLTVDNGQITASYKPAVVGKDLLSAEVQAQLTKKQGQPSPPVTCPNDLHATEGASTSCFMKAPDGVYNVTVTVTKLDWTGFGNFGVGNAIFDTKVADRPNAA